MEISYSHQRVPMLSATMLEDRTRPAVDGPVASRVRFLTWPNWSHAPERQPSHQRMPTRTRLGRR